MYNLAYLIEPPTYLCLINGTWKSGDSCTIDDICQQKPYITDYKIDFDQGSGSLHNWWEKLDLICMPEWQTHFMGTAFFVGWCSTLLWLPRLSDKHGRKMIFAYGMIAQTICMVFLMITKSVYAVLITIFALGALTTIRINIGFLWLMELLPKKN